MRKLHDYWGFISCIVILCLVFCACDKQNDYSLTAHNQTVTTVDNPSTTLTHMQDQDINEKKKPELILSEINVKEPISIDEAFTAVYRLKTDRANEFIGADYLLRDRNELFAEYDGVSDHLHIKVGENKDWEKNYPVITDTVYYWHDSTREASPNRAAAVLLDDMLEDLKARGNEFSFHITQYKTPAYQNDLRDWQDLLWEDLHEVWYSSMPRDYFFNDLDRLLPYQMTDGDYSFQSETLALPLVEDLWVVIPQFSFAYSGTFRMLQFDQISPEELTVDGLFLHITTMMGILLLCSIYS